MARNRNSQRPYLLVVAAGGYATRALVLTGYGAKPKAFVNAGVGGATVLEEITREANRSGIDECVVITSSDRVSEVFARFYDPLGLDPSFDEYLQRRQRTDELDLVASRPTFRRVHFVIQSEPRGFGDAIALAEPYLRAGTENGDPFAGAVVALGDDVVHAETPAIRQLISAHRLTGDMIVGVQRVTKEQARGFGVVVVDPNPLALSEEFCGRTAYRVVGMEEKPSDPTPNQVDGEEVYLAVVGRYLVNLADMAFLSKRTGTVEQELDFTALQQQTANAGRLIAIELTGTWHTVGSSFGAQKAFMHYALVPETGDPTAEQEELRRWVRGLLETVD